MGFKIRFNFHKSGGYILPATILLGVATTLVSITFMAFLSQVSDKSNQSIYSNIAREAARSGIQYALGCASMNDINWTNAKPLMSSTKCDGVADSASPYLTSNGTYRSSFAVSPMSPDGAVESVGKVELLAGGVITKTITSSSKTQILSNQILKPSTGKSVTQIAIAHNNCYIADGELYCSGADEWGELGTGPTGAAVDTTWNHRPSVWPQKVQAALAGKTITKVAMGTSTVCAIADGIGYCWGDNTMGQVGNDRTWLGFPDPGYNSTKIPPFYESTPRAIQGPLAGKYIQDISVKDITWTSGLEFTHMATCAVAAGAPYCWGSNKYGETGFPTCSEFPGWNFTEHKWQHSCYVNKTGNMAAGNNKPVALWGYGEDNTWVNCNNWDNADPVMGSLWGIPYVISYPYHCTGAENGVTKRPNSSAPMRADSEYANSSYGGVEPRLWGKKIDSILIGSHTGCGITEGKNYCWGVVPPLAILGIAALPIQASSGTGLIDPASTGGGADMLCYMQDFTYKCLGRSLAIRSTWSLTSLLASYTAAPSGTDVQKTTNNQTPYTQEDGGWGQPNPNASATFCMIINGSIACSGMFNGHSTDLMTNSSTTTSNGLGYVSQTSDMPGGIGMQGKHPTDVSAGEDHNCAVANGQLYCWGSPGWAYFLPNGDTRFGLNLSDPATWGRNMYGVAYPTLMGHKETVNPMTGTKNIPAASAIGTDINTVAATQIATGDNHSCGIVNGQAYCWGDNSKGQLGNNSTTSSAQPVNTSLFNTSTQSLTKITAGANHTCGISNGLLYCWGDNSAGQLGLGAVGSQSTPQQVKGAINGMRVSDVSAGGNSTCAIANMRLYCWGANNSYQLGDGSATARNTPVLINNAASDIKAADPVYSVSVSSTHGCAVAAGDLYCWGANTSGQTGLNLTTGNTTRPKLVTGGSAGSPRATNGMTPYVSQVSVGTSHSCAVINNTVSCWGDNTNGRLGTSAGNKSVPTAITNSYYATQVSAGDAHTCALLHGNNSKTNGNLFCWGRNSNYQLGNGTNTDRTTATVVNGGNVTSGGVRGTTTSISAGKTHTCSITNAQILCWGTSADGALGGASPTSSTTPQITKDYILTGVANSGVMY